MKTIRMDSTFVRPLTSCLEYQATKPFYHTFRSILMKPRFLACTIAVVLVGWLLPRFVVSEQAQTTDSNTPGRYAISVAAAPGQHTIILCDTSTGKCWRQNEKGGTWAELGSPAQATTKKKK